MFFFSFWQGGAFVVKPDQMQVQYVLFTLVLNNHNKLCLEVTLLKASETLILTHACKFYSLLPQPHHHFIGFIKSQFESFLLAPSHCFWVLQVVVRFLQLNRSFLCLSSPVVKMMNALLILIFVPIFDLIIYPLVGLCKINLT